jgi:hypothetical protein
VKHDLQEAPEPQEVIGLPKRERVIRSRTEFTASKPQQILVNRAANSTSAKVVKTFGDRMMPHYVRSQIECTADGNASKS